jgi:hypothetical protein
MSSVAGIRYHECMKLELRKMQDENEYKEFVERYYYLADGELRDAESFRARDDHHEVALLLPQLISIVNIVGYLRGQDNRFVTLRPSTGFQSALYEKESEFERRLRALIDFVKATASAALLLESIREYYLKNRGL